MQPKLSIIVGLIFFPFVLLAQIPKGWAIEATLHTGFVTKHTPELTIDNAGITEGLTIDLKYQTFGLKSWHNKQNYPQLGVQFGLFRLSSHKQLGNAIGILPNITIPFIRKDSWQLKTQFGMGVAWLTKPFNSFTNPLNNAVGSHLNNYTALSLYVEKKWTNNWMWNVGFSFSHFSNGSAQLPNYGLNIPALAIGISNTPFPIKNNDFIAGHIDNDYRRWGFFVQTTAARQEFIGSNGPKYPIYNLAIAVTFTENDVHTSSLGVEYEYNYAVFNFFKFLEKFDAKETISTGRRVMIFGGHELGFGPVKLGGQIGVYVGPFRYLIRHSFYNKIHLKYHFMPFGKKGIKPFIGLYMKAHLVEAEYIAVGMGLQF